MLYFYINCVIYGYRWIGILCKSVCQSDLLIFAVCRVNHKLREAKSMGVGQLCTFLGTFIL